MRKQIVITAAGIALAGAVVVGGAAIAGGATGEEGSDQYTPQQAADATAAALDITGGGTANSVERDGEDGATWEVEVTRPDGTTVDVRLDESYALVVVEDDHEHSDGS